MSDQLTHLSLFSGIGGLDLAAELADFRTVGQCERADFPTKVLEKHWPDVPRWKDIRSLTKESFYEKTGLRTVDVISGGFPCQPFSVAGERKGKDDDRYLWPELLRIVQEIRPTWFVGENVAGIVTMELDTVLSDLESSGYSAQAFIIPACAADAPHRRDRCAIVAHTESDGLQRLWAEREQERRARLKAGKSKRRCQVHNGGKWRTEPGVGRVANGVPNRMDRIRCLGNAVVPQQFYPIFKAIAEIDRAEKETGGNDETTDTH